jgi:hypothetical protein
MNHADAHFALNSGFPTSHGFHWVVFTPKLSICTIPEYPKACEHWSDTVYAEQSQHLKMNPL